MAKPARRAGSKKASAAKKALPKKPLKSAAKSKPKAVRGPAPADKQRFTLYGFAGSTATYTAALGLALMRHPFSYIHVSLRDGAHKQPDFLVKNRYGQVPALRDGQVYYVQSAAILLHLAETLDKLDGKTPAEKQHVREWLFWQWDKLAVPVFRLRARARGLRQFGEEVRTMYDQEAKQAFAVLDHELARNEWIAAKKPSVADVSIYVVARFAHEANIDLNPFKNVIAWKKRIEELPGFATPEMLLPMESRLL
jgi:glutathione S-transferase